MGKLYQIFGGCHWQASQAIDWATANNQLHITLMAIADSNITLISKQGRIGRKLVYRQLLTSYLYSDNYHILLSVFTLQYLTNIFNCKFISTSCYLKHVSQTTPQSKHPKESTLSIIPTLRGNPCNQGELGLWCTDLCQIEMEIYSYI